MRRFLAATALAAAVALLSPSPPVAASCAVLGTPPANPFAAARVAFVGVVMSTLHDGRVALVGVESVWAGPDLPAVVEVRGSTAVLTPVAADIRVTSSVDRAFRDGERYVFAPSNERPPFQDSACSGTRPYTPAVAALAPLTARPPDPRLPTAAAPTPVPTLPPLRPSAGPYPPPVPRASTTAERSAGAETDGTTLAWLVGLAVFSLAAGVLAVRALIRQRPR